MSFISYAQNDEDVMLWRALKHVAKGFYIDVGANDPKIDSVTKAFYDSGWHGINIEPIKTHFRDLSVARERDINLLAAAGKESGHIDIWECEIRGWATASPMVIAMHEANGHVGTYHKIPVFPLKEICAQYSEKEIHFLKIDVEGYEKEVIDGMDFEKYRPWIVVVEATKPNSTEEVHLEWEETLTSKDYLLAYCDGLNRFYLAAERQNLMTSLRYPPNVFDGHLRVQHHDAELRAQQNESLVQKLRQQLKEEASQAQNRDQQTQNQLAQTQAQLQQALQVAQTSQSQALNAETNAQQLKEELHKQVSQAQKQNQQSQEQLAQTQAQLQQVLQLAHKSQTQALNAEANSKQLEQQLHKQTSEAQNQVQQSRNQLSKTQAHLEQALQISQVVHQQMQNALTFAEHARQAEKKGQSYLQDLEVKNAAIATLQQELDNIHKANHHHFLQLGQTRQELHDLHQANHHHWQLAQQRQQFIEAMQRSWSWKLTTPVRLAGALLLQPLQTFKTLANKTLAWVLNTFQKPLVKFMVWVLTKPQLAERINARLLSYPHLHAHLLAIARQAAVIHQVQQPSNALYLSDVILPVSCPTLEQLSPRAQQIYIELKAAIAQQHKGDR